MIDSPGRFIENSIFSVAQKFYKNGIEIEKGTLLTRDKIEKNRKLYEYYCNLWSAYPDLFLDLIGRDDEKIELYFYQRIFLRACMRFRYHYCTAPRAFSKTFLSILALFLKCMFQPKSKIFICAPAKSQAAKVAREKMIEIFRYWPILKKEVIGGDISDLPGNYGKDYVQISFKNGSILDVVGALDTQRGGRRHAQILKKNVDLHEKSRIDSIKSYLYIEDNRRINIMKGYIYRITNIVNNKCYIGITENFKNRQKKHITELNNNIHHSPKLQNAWNYYGGNNFEWTVREVCVDSYEDLYKLEIQEIAKFDSYNNGYNCTVGGGVKDWKQKVKNEDIITFLCIQYIYGDGYGKTCEQIFGWSNGTASAAKCKTRYLDAIEEFEKLAEIDKRKIAEEKYNELNINEIHHNRQLQQGGCDKAYKLSKEDFFFAFCAQELGYKYTPVGLFLEVNPNTVKDWFNGRSRKKEKDEYNKLSLEDKNKYKKLVNDAHLEAIGQDRLQNKKEQDIIDFLCYDEFFEQNDTVIQNIFGWSEGTCYSIRMKNRYPITKAKVSLYTLEYKKERANQLNGRVKTAE